MTAQVGWKQPSLGIQKSKRLLNYVTLLTAESMGIMLALTWVGDMQLAAAAILSDALSGTKTIRTSRK